MQKIDKQAIALEIGKFLPRRKKGAHKGTAGHVLVAAGSPGKTGAASMTVAAAFRTGSGLVTLLTDPRSLKVSAVQVREAFLNPFPADEKSLKAFLKEKQAMVVGPGLGFSLRAKKMLWGILTCGRVPVVVDADALTLISKRRSQLKRAKAPIILTPHPGEMARLIGKTVPFVQRHRTEVARAFAKRFGVTVVLKGAGTVMAAPTGEVSVNISGDPAMASAGAGDVLAGMIASFIGQGLSIEKGVKAAVFIHGLLGERWRRKRKASRGLMARDLIELIPETIESLIKKR